MSKARLENELQDFAERSLAAGDRAAKAEIALAQKEVEVTELRAALAKNEEGEVTREMWITEYGDGAVAGRQKMKKAGLASIKHWIARREKSSAVELVMRSVSSPNPRFQSLR